MKKNKNDFNLSDMMDDFIKEKGHLIMLSKKEATAVEEWIKEICKGVIADFKEHKNVITHGLVFAYDSKLQELQRQGNAKKMIAANSTADPDDDEFSFMHIPMGAMVEDDAHKEVAAEMLRSVVMKTEALAYGLVTEAWCTLPQTKAKKDSEGNWIRPSTLPPDQRREVIIINIETKDWVQMVAYEIIREDKEPWLYKIEDMSYNTKDMDDKEVYKNEGKFSGFLYRTPKQRAKSMVHVIQEMIAEIGPIPTGKEIDKHLDEKLREIKKKYLGKDG